MRQTNSSDAGKGYVPFVDGSIKLACYLAHVGTSDQPDRGSLQRQETMLLSPCASHPSEGFSSRSLARPTNARGASQEDSFSGTVVVIELCPELYSDGRLNIGSRHSAVHRV